MFITMSSTRGRSNPSKNKSQSRDAGKSKQAPAGNKAGSLSNQHGAACGLYRCEACNRGFLRGLASLHIHQRHQCPVLTLSNLFHCDQCGHGIFRGKSSLDLHKRKLCTKVPIVAYTEVEGAGGAANEEKREVEEGEDDDEGWEREEEEGEDAEEEEEGEDEEEGEEREEYYEEGEERKEDDEGAK